MRLSVMKEMSVKWLEGLYDHLRASRQMIMIKKAGIANAVENPPVPAYSDSDGDPFADSE